VQASDPELAAGATLFLDEIGDMSLLQQGRLLNLLRDLDQHGRFAATPSAGRSSAPLLRIVAATHANLEDRVKHGEFREDLYYRLTTFPIYLPALRDRGADLIDLAWYFYREYSALHRKSLAGIAPVALDAIRRYHYPGNVRELENAIERAVLLCDPFEKISCEHLPESWCSDAQSRVGALTAGIAQRDVVDESCAEQAIPAQWQGDSLRDAVNMFEADIIRRALRSNDWNQTHTADSLGIPRRTLIDKMSRFNIDVPGRRRRVDDK
jgi:DNA-binding NtrC family response regulator